MNFLQAYEDGWWDMSMLVDQHTQKLGQAKSCLQPNQISYKLEIKHWIIDLGRLASHEAKKLKLDPTEKLFMSYWTWLKYPVYTG